MMLPYLLAAFAGCFLLEHLIPGWPLPRVKTWPFRVIIVNLAQLAVVMMAGYTWERWLSSASLFHLRDHVSPSAGGMVAYFIATFIFFCGIVGGIVTTVSGGCSIRFITVRNGLR